MKFEKIYPKRILEEEKQHKAEMEEQSADFSETWRHPEKIITSTGEEVDLYDMRPKEEKTPVPVVMVGGWTANAELWKKNMREFVSRGRRAMIVDATHGADYHPEALDLDERAGDVERRRISGVFAGLDAKGIEKADAVAHSEGCIDLLLAAVSYPERFRNIVLVEPAGMIGSDSLFALLWRNQVKDVPAMTKAHEAQKRGAPGFTFDVHPDDQMFPDVMGKAMKTFSDKRRSFQELLSIARIQTVDLLREVKSKGIGVVIVHGAEDEMFPMNRVAETLRGQKRSDEPDYSNIVDGFYSVKGVHVRFHDQPVEYTQLAEGALTALEAKQSKG